MNFTFSEWLVIRHAMEVAKREYERIKDTCKPSDEELSMYQIYKRQIAEIDTLINKLNNSII